MKKEIGTMKKIVALILCLVTLASVAVIGVSAADDCSDAIVLNDKGELGKVVYVLFDKSKDEAEYFQFWEAETVYGDVRFYVSPAKEIDSKYLYVQEGYVYAEKSEAFVKVSSEMPDPIGVVTLNIPVNIVREEYVQVEGVGTETTTDDKYDWVDVATGSTVVTIKVESVCTHANANFETGKWFTLRKATLFNEGVEQYFCPDCNELLRVRETPALINKNPAKTLNVISAAVSAVKTVVTKIGSLFGNK